MGRVGYILSCSQQPHAFMTTEPLLFPAPICVRVCRLAGEEGDLAQADQGVQKQDEEDPRHRSSYRQTQGEEGRKVDGK